MYCAPRLATGLPSAAQPGRTCFVRQPHSDPHLYLVHSSAAVHQRCSDTVVWLRLWAYNWTAALRGSVPCQVSLVVSQPGKPKGRGNRAVPVPSPVEQLARDHGLGDDHIVCPVKAKEVRGTVGTGRGRGARGTGMGSARVCL